MKFLFEIFLVISLPNELSSEQGIYKFHPDLHLSTIKLINKYGYTVEVHDVETEDGYIITIFRIPHGKRGSGVNRKPILLMHGLLGQAENFIINGIHNGSLAYFLADNGYDVWLGNHRGTQHGMRHKVLNYRDKSFWNFSIHELGIYDLPALIDHALQTTHKPNLFYSGHSQGGSIFFILTSVRPEYQQKIRLASLLAPAGYQRHFKNPILTPLVSEYKALEQIVELLDIHALPPPGVSFRQLVRACCTILQDFCLTIYFMIAVQLDYAEFDRAMLPLVMKFTASVSVKQLLHFAQSIDSGHFRPFDYGEKNMEIYGKPLPEDYPLRNIRVPTAFYYTYHDKFAFAEDIEDMCDALSNCVYKYIMKKGNWSHSDIIFGTDIAKDLFGPFLEFANKYDVNGES